LRDKSAYERFGECRTYFPTRSTEMSALNSGSLFLFFRSVGGIRASLYNAVTLEEVKLLVEYMKAFQKNNQ